MYTQTDVPCTHAVTHVYTYKTRHTPTHVSVYTYGKTHVPHVHTDTHTDDLSFFLVPGRGQESPGRGGEKEPITPSLGRSRPLSTRTDPRGGPRRGTAGYR